MARLYGKTYSPAQLRKHVGHMSQVAGIRRFELSDGREKGVAAAEVRTGTGLRFTVLLDRGMDISSAEWCGCSLSWRSATLDTSPYFFQPEGLEWLRGFFGGLLCTCGLTYCGAPCEDEGEELGLHGRVSNTPAENVVADERWVGSDYVMTLRGTVIEAGVFRDSLSLTREITAMLGENRLLIHDTVENIGFDPAPHMFLYHINLGFPLVDEGAELVSPTTVVTPRDPVAEDGKRDYAKIDPPTRGYAEKVYYHRLASARGGQTLAGLVNPSLGCEGLGVYLQYSTKEFPEFTEWKQMGQGTYTVGLEPANCRVEGRDKERGRGALTILRPGERREYHMEIGVLIHAQAIKEFRRRVRALCRGRSARFEKNEDV